MPGTGRYAERSRGRLYKIQMSKVGAKPIPKDDIIPEEKAKVETITTTSTSTVTTSEGDSSGQESKEEAQEKEKEVNT